MSIIDEKGRILGRFNTLDITIALFAILFIVVVYVKITSEDKLSPVVITDICKKKEVIVEVILDHPWIADYVSVGDDQQLEEDEYMQLFAIEHKKIKLSDGSRKAVAKFRIKAKINYSGKLSVQRYILEPGGPALFYGPNYILSGTIYKVYDAPAEK